MSIQKKIKSNPTLNKDKYLTKTLFKDTRVTVQFRHEGFGIATSVLGSRYAKLIHS